MKTKWEVLSPKQSCLFYLTSRSTPATRSWVGARKTVLLKTQNEIENQLRKRGHAGIPHSSCRASPLLQGHGHKVSPVSEVHLAEWRLRRESTVTTATEIIVCQFYHISFCPLSQEIVSMSSDLSYGPPTESISNISFRYQKDTLKSIKANPWNYVFLITSDTWLADMLQHFWKKYRAE